MRCTSRPWLSSNSTAPPATSVTSTESPRRLSAPPIPPEPATVLPTPMLCVVAPVSVLLQISVPGWPAAAEASVQTWAPPAGCASAAPENPARVANNRDVNLNERSRCMVSPNVKSRPEHPGMRIQRAAIKVPRWGASSVALRGSDYETRRLQLHVDRAANAFPSETAYLQVS